jgi:ADP-ribose pyrophosphatase
VERVLDDFFAVDKAVVRFEQRDGSMSEPHSRLSVERGDSVGMLVRDADTDEFLFVRQFRYPCVRHGDAWLLEIPAGKQEPGESLEASAKRELEEEIGFTARSLRQIAAFYGSPGGLSELTTIFFGEVSASDRVGTGGGTDDGEDVEIVRVACAEAVRQAMAGEIRDAKAAVGLLWYAASCR